MALLRRLGFIAFAAVVAPAGMAGLGVLLAWGLRRQPLWQLVRRGPSWGALGYGLVGGMTSMGLVVALTVLSKRFARAIARSGSRTAVDSVEQWGWPAMLVIGIGAAAGEEMLFRGGLQPTVGIALAALAFGLAHGGWRREMWAYVVSAVLAGLVFGNIFSITGDLWSSFLAHATHNSVSIALVALGAYPGLDDEEEEPVEELQPPAQRPTPRELGVRPGLLSPGPHNAITDVPGVLVGHATLFAGQGPLQPGSGPVRTGVTAVLPHGGNLFREKVPAAVAVLNGFGKPTGFVQIEELGVLETPVLLTGTMSVWRAADALVGYMLEQAPEIAVTTSTVNPVVLECNDARLNDAQGRHVGPEQVRAALAAASGGSVRQGAIGAGTGMVSFQYKGGIGTASRRLDAQAGGYTVGAMVLANFGRRRQLVVDGVPVGQALAAAGAADEVTPAEASAPPPAVGEPETPGSCAIVLATDAPLDARRLQRIARRAGLGLARTGGVGAHGSGDYALAFSTANRATHDNPNLVASEALLNESHPTMDGLLAAAVEATEEAILSALFCADSVAGRDGAVAEGFPVDQVLALLREAGRLSEV